MTADGPALWGPPRDNRLSSQGVLDGLKPGSSRRASRGFFSLFSSKGQQQQSSSQPMKLKQQRPKSSFPSNQPLEHRFDSISLTSPSQRDDPAFSRDPSVHHAHVLSAPRRSDIIRSSASDDLPRRSPPIPAVAVNLQHGAPPHHHSLPDHNPPEVKQGNITGPRYDTDHYSSYYASHSSLTLPPSNDSLTSSPMSPSSSPSFLSGLPTPTGMPAQPPEAREDPSPSVTVDSLLAETFDTNRPASPPPDYEIISSPRPSAFRTDSAPELRHIEPPGLPHRSATAPIPTPPPAAPKRTNDRRPQGYDLDRIDELDESNPLGVALHHEGPFQVIASVLKGPQPPGSQFMSSSTRTAKAPKPGNNGGSLGISPGQVLPRNFQYYQPPAFRPEYNTSPQASTSYIPPHGTNHMRAPPVAQERVNQDPRWLQSYPNQQPPPLPPNARASYVPPQTQYDPLPADGPYNPPPPHHPANPQHPPSNPPPGHVSYSSEDNSDAYGGIEQEIAPKRDRRSAPPVPSQMEPYFVPQNSGPNNFQPRRHSTKPGFNPPVDPRVFQQDPDRLNAGQSLLNLRHSPNGGPIAGFLDPRLRQNRDQLNAAQNLSGMRRSPNGQPPQQPYAEVMGHNPPQGNHMRVDEHDRRRPTSYQPQSTPPQNLPRGPLQQQVGPMGENDPRRRASYQPVLPPPAGAMPADLQRQQFERQQQIAGPVIQDRQQSVAPSIVSSVNTRRGPQPQHIPKHLVMPTPLQQNSQLPNHSPPQSYPAEHYPVLQHVRFDTSQAQPTRAQTIQMVQDRDGGRHLLRKRSSVVQASTPVMPPKAPPMTRQQSYMEPPPTVPQTPIPRPVQQEKKRHKRLLSKRRTDL
ncbi:hypothetical protein C8R43DRAFT_199836 [Mycena crocata]|nr:hypothetical protein C8R43DRAFT_199836 [Mycena crocata]